MLILSAQNRRIPQSGRYDLIRLRGDHCALIYLIIWRDRRQIQNNPPAPQSPVIILYMDPDIIPRATSTHVNPLTAKLLNWNFHPLEVVSCWRDPKLQVSENYSDLRKWRSTNFKSCWLMSLFIFNMFKSWYVMWYKKIKNDYGRHRRLKG